MLLRKATDCAVIKSAFVSNHIKCNGFYFKVKTVTQEKNNSSIAQLVEQRTVNPFVPGSSPG